MSEDLYNIEKDLLLEGIYRLYGYDFREYAEESLRRRIKKAMAREGVESVSAFQDMILHDVKCMERFVGNLAIHVTSMFRDPDFYLTFRNRVVPLLRTYPFVRIWIAGCSSGEEVFSTAIVLSESGIYDRCRIYATDISDAVLKRAKEGIFPLNSMKEYTRNYLMAGGEGEFSSYYTAKYDHAIFRPSLLKNVTFAQHNLTSDASFNEFNVIFCRNVMIYFTRTLQERVLKLFDESLCRLGILGLGKKESLKYSASEGLYEELVDAQRLYRRLP